MSGVSSTAVSEIDPPPARASWYEIRNLKNTKRCPHQHLGMDEAVQCARDYVPLWRGVNIWVVMTRVEATLLPHYRHPRCITCRQAVRRGTRRRRRRR